MDVEYLDDIQFSHQKLMELLTDVIDNKQRDIIITEYIKSCKNDPIQDFPQDMEWFNIAEPLSIEKHLKGKLVLLDFFTYCCINCMHILPDLKAIENEFSIEDGLVVIGVHSAKFDNEKLSTNILSAVQRYNISHPVINDCEAKIWNNCGINCWPSLLLLGPKGNPLILLMGEGHLENLRTYIKCALKYYKTKKEISNHNLPLKSAFHLLPELKGPLLFPGKIANYVDNENNSFDKIAISDTGNNRILITSMDGEILFNIGGKQGFKDGNFQEAQFFGPQGLVFLNEHVLFVADTENHAIRRVDLSLGVVLTVVGTGEQGVDRIGGKMGLEQQISSPWDLCVYKTPDMDMSFHHPNDKIVEKDVLIIAMAGTHQIWALFLEDTIWWRYKRYSKGTCMCIAGSGREENRNNAYPQSAAFAQPSGLALCQQKKELYIADSESSTIRRLSLTDGKVSPVVGGDKNPLNLFGFGDKDGKLSEAKLQHPLGLAMGNHPFLYITDTYNHKIKRIDTTTNTVTTLKWDSIGQIHDNIFNEPSGLFIREELRKLYITDTNNHCIKVIHLSDDLNIREINKLTLKPQKNKKNNIDLSKYTILAGKNFEVSQNGGKIILRLKMTFKDGTKLTIDAPQKWLVVSLNDMWSAVPKTGKDVNFIETVINVENSGDLDFFIVCNYVICKGELCLPKNLAVKFNVKFSKDAPLEICEEFNIFTGLNDEIRN